MASTVNVRIRVDDDSRAGIARVRAQMRRLARDIQRTGATARFTVDINEELSRRRAEAAMRRITQGLRDSNASVRVRVNPDVDGNAFSRALRRTLAVPLRSLGDTFSDGFGQAIARGMYAAANNPYVAAAVLALVATIVSLLGAALAGTLTFVFGGALIGLGGFIAAQSKRVKDAFSKELEALKPLFKEAAEPMIPVLEHGIELMGEMGRKFAPAFQRALEASAPFLTEFMDRLAAGMEKFGEIAGGPMMEAFNELLTVLGPQLEEWFVSLGESFKYLGEVVKENKEEIALAMRIVLELVPLAIRLVAWLAEQWANIVRMIQAVIVKAAELWGWMTRAWTLIVYVSAPYIQTIIGNVQSLWGWVARNWSRSVRFNAPGIARIIEFVRTLWGWVARSWSRSVRFNAPGISRIINLVKDLWGWVNRNWFKSVNFSFSMSGPVGAIQKLLGLATGGVAGVGRRIGTAATGGIRNNQTLVGEHGPELVDLPTGSRVRSNSDTRRLMGKAGGGEGTVIRIEAGNSALDQLLLQILRRAIRVEGGNVQYVLGRGMRG